MTTRAYLRLSPRAFHEKVVVDRYPPGAFAAFLAVLCLAEEQPERGRFRSEKLLRLLLDEPAEGVHVGWGKWLRHLVDHGDLVRQKGGVLYVAGWDEWQEGDVTVTERMNRLRSRKRPDVTVPVTPDVTVPVTPPVTVPIVTVPSERKAYSESESESRSGGPSRPPSPNGQEDRHDEGRLVGGFTAEERRIMAATASAAVKAPPKKPPPDDAEVIERCRAVLTDPDAPAWKRDAALHQLAVLGVPESTA
jgi:hypothetical protein